MVQPTSCETDQMTIGAFTQQIPCSMTTVDNHANMPWLFEPTTDSNSKPRRPRATLRERQRMAQVNNAFENLRRVVPRGHMTDYQRLSKIATLRLAIQYIKAMSHILGKPLLVNRRSKSENPMTNNQTQTIHQATRKYNSRSNKLSSQTLYKSHGRTIRSRRNLRSVTSSNDYMSVPFQNYTSKTDSNQEVNKTLMLFGYEPKLTVESKWENAYQQQSEMCDSIDMNPMMATTHCLHAQPGGYDLPDRPQSQYCSIDPQTHLKHDQARQIGPTNQVYLAGSSSCLSTYYCHCPCDCQPNPMGRQIPDYFTNLSEPSYQYYA